MPREKATRNNSASPRAGVKRAASGSKGSSALERAEAIYFPSRSALRAWLTQHHASHAPIWVVYDKKTANVAGSLDFDQIVEEAICFGWIDSLPGRVDEKRTKLYLAPRKPKAVWSALNRSRIDALISSGRMTPAGLAKINQAKRDGSWDALKDVANVDRGVLPDDLEAALKRNRTAWTNFANFPPGVRRQTVQWIVTAKRAETRAERVRVSVAMAAENLRAHEPKSRAAFLKRAE